MPENIISTLCREMQWLVEYNAMESRVDLPEFSNNVLPPPLRSKVKPSNQQQKGTHVFCSLDASRWLHAWSSLEPYR
jgi:hypothetical protein